MDFTHEINSAAIKIFGLFNVIYDFNRERMAIDQDVLLPALRVIRSLDHIIGWVPPQLDDIGKIWSYESGTLTSEAAELGHEHIGLERLLPALQRLCRSCATDGLVLHGLLAGRG